ncbi:MAG: hypothetical protein IJL02_11450 [Methanobrevibacter sp.]|uniref:right-handed parallel beta-helix repeat-containing protein n=1 Tax=Methanobrevibacter sp. TaxID=66852 RepID=UPI0025F96417|nr:right-handed parallel beta-helix repeat-containing protein [Methanobrevibacter sp.]MBQ6100461.1 hypothetical protein [Methanobrevibacter sp.]
MGFLNKIKKAIQTKEEEDFQKPPSENVSFKASDSFSDLDRLIHSGSHEINLTGDIILSGDESAFYRDGIHIGVDNLVIDANGHAIDAGFKTRIFKIGANNITFKNVKFKNAISSESGGAIFNNGISVKFFNCEFTGCSSQTGGAIANYPNYSMEFDSCKFSNNKSSGPAGAIFNGGNITINNSEFINNQAKEGGAINTQIMASVEIVNSQFIANTASGAGAIFSASEVKITSSDFQNNTSTRSAGAIANGGGGTLTVEDSTFSNNSAETDGGAILSGFGEIKIIKSKFIKNSSNDTGGVIKNIGIINICGSDFKANSSDNIGGAIYNDNEATLSGCRFEDNISQSRGGALYNSGPLTGNELIFINNASKGGGALYSDRDMSLKDSTFENNASNMGAAIMNDRCSSVLDNVEFINNESDMRSVVYNMGGEIKAASCKFLNHEVSYELIYNENASLTFIDSIFGDNKSRSTIFNDKNSTLSIFGGEFSKNSCEISVIENENQVGIDESAFDSNVSAKQFSENIYNKGHLTLTKPKFKTLNQNKCILNENHIDVKKIMREEIEDNIQNLGEVEYFMESEDKQNGFELLDDLIRNSNTLEINLAENIQLKNNEREFYEGGIELDRDNLIINGNDHIIDANSNSRIFYITGRDITLKNIIFKNGSFLTQAERNASGGGAIKIVKDASLKLENCKFLDNSSEDYGGAILNNGILNCENTEFENNLCDSFGGAVFNRNIFISKNDQFKDNKSEIAGAIYNCGDLTVRNITQQGNNSNISYPIFNNNIMKSFDNPENIIYNIGSLNKEDMVAKSFTYLNGQISSSDNIALDTDIVFDYKSDLEFKEGLLIEKDLIINGNGFSIDAAGIASFFNIKNPENEVTFKNISFKNAFSHKLPIFDNKGLIRFENCRFISNKLADDAHFIKNDKSLKIINSVFSNNSSKKGSIIHNNKSVEITGCEFLINETGVNFGIIYNFHDAKLDNLSFNTNYSKDYIIGNGDKASLAINNNEFINNVLDISVIINLASLQLRNSQFKKNISNLKCSCMLSSGTLNADECSFISNVGNFEAGVILNHGKSVLNNCEFKDNISKQIGGAISNSGELTLLNSSFINNSADWGGGAIYNAGDLDISHLKFINNKSKTTGGAIDNSESILSVSDSLFDKNQADRTGGAIYDQDGSLNIKNTTFTENVAKEDGAIHSTANANSIVKCSFHNNHPE